MARLKPQQEKLLLELIHAERNAGESDRSPFYASQTFDGADVMHPGFPGRNHRIYWGDVQGLLQFGLIMPTKIDTNLVVFELAPAAYEYAKHVVGVSSDEDPAEAMALAYIDASQFANRHPTAFEAWRKARDAVAVGGSDTQLTEVGHWCREAMQAFMSDLVGSQGVRDADPDPAHTIARLRGVVSQRTSETGETVAAFLTALVAYWGTLSDLVQRQEHGAQRDAEALGWHDARRIVFHTLAVMHELDASL